MKKIFSVRSLSLIAVLLGISLLTFQTISHATTIIHTPFAQMCREADAVIEGTVVSKSSKVLTGFAGIANLDMIVTDVVLNNIVLLKGKRPNTVIVGHMGGTVGSQTMIVPGVPGFEIGERNVIFLDKDNAILGAWEGVFTVKEVAPGATIIERADGGVVTQDFDALTGELKLSYPGQMPSKPTFFVWQESFRELIRKLAAPPPRREPVEVGE